VTSIRRANDIPKFEERNLQYVIPGLPKGEPGILLESGYSLDKRRYAVLQDSGSPLDGVRNDES